jgi:REP element-mobilizing transposase RayT
MDKPVEQKDNLPRLLRHHYQGHAVVLWTLTMEQRAAGWLDELFHFHFGELMLHAAAREKVWCPAYCLMPDHLHFVWMGMRRESDQLNAMRFLRRQLAPALKPHKFQHQAHDHVLREDERKRGAFARVCFYVLENPVRAKLAVKAADWPFSGAIVPGYPALRPTEENFWEKFWGFYVAEREGEPPAPTVPPLQEIP